MIQQISNYSSCNFWIYFFFVQIENMSSLVEVDLHLGAMLLETSDIDKEVWQNAWKSLEKNNQINLGNTLYSYKHTQIWIMYTSYQSDTFPKFVCNCLFQLKKSVDIND